MFNDSLSLNVDLRLISIEVLFELLAHRTQLSSDLEAIQKKKRQQNERAINSASLSEALRKLYQACPLLIAVCFR